MTAPYAMSLAAAVAYTSRPYDRIYKALKSGELPGKRDGRSWVIRRADLEAWIDGMPADDDRKED